MTTLTFSVRGQPVAYSRTRLAFDPRSGKPRFVTAAADRAWREQVASVAALEAKRQGWRDVGGPLALTVVVHRPIPASASRNQKIKLAGQPCAVRPDCDNYLKAILDAGNVAGIWHDDAQIVDARVRKLWAAAEQAGVEVEVVAG